MRTNYPHPPTRSGPGSDTALAMGRNIGGGCNAVRFLHRTAAPGSAGCSGTGHSMACLNDRKYSGPAGLPGSW